MTTDQAYAELQATTNFSFLRGASHPAELVAVAEALGYRALAVTDRNTLAGVVRAWSAARENEVGLRLLVGCRLDLEDGPGLLAYPTDREAYGRLCRLLTSGKLRTRKAGCRLALEDVRAHAAGMILAVVPPEGLPTTGFAETLRAVAAWPVPVYLAAARRHRADDRARLAALDALGRETGAPIVAVQDLLYHAPERRPLQDVLACVRGKVPITEAGLSLEANAERHPKPVPELERLFRGFEHALDRTLEIADAVRFDLGDLKYEYPDEPVPPGRTAQEHLEDLVWRAAGLRLRGEDYEKIRPTLEKELALIARLDYARYFLTIHDIVRFAEDRGILCQGRGSAANSAVCWALGITAVSPAESDLLFERFLSEERKEPPDIDVDFEHERREAVIQYLYQRYGRERAGICATVIHYRPRSAVREVGKALGLTPDVTAALAGTVWGGWGRGFDEAQIRQAGLDPANPLIRRVAALATELVGFPRHLSQHVGGFVLTRDRLDETVPIGNGAMPDRTFVEWDKDDIDALGILKVDVLGLGMLTCIRKCFALLEEHEGQHLDLDSVPRDDPGVYDMLCAADTIGVFQVESRAQMNMLPRLRPRVFYDLVIEVAIVRPGPIQGDMVHPYLRRRAGQEEVVLPGPSPEHGPPDELRRILGKTKGVPLFQEQAMRIAIEAARFTPGEANGLRRAMATFRNAGTIHEFEQMMVERMAARGYERAFAERCFSQIRGFGEYGFPESHAASFARLVWVSSWLKHHHPAVFACGLLNSQPMGFYAPAQIVGDARAHGVEVRPVDVNASGWDCALERDGEGGALALRLGFRQVDGFAKAWAGTLVEVREEGGAFPDLGALQARAGLPRAALERLAAADALGSLGLGRRPALWAASGLAGGRPPPLLAAAAEGGAAAPEAQAELPLMRPSEEVIADYQVLRLSLKGHPMLHLRDLFGREGASTCVAATAARNGAAVRVAGVVLVRQKPGSAKGVLFLTLEDETGIANAVLWPKVALTFRREVMTARLLLVDGRIQRSPEGIVHLVAGRLVDRTAELRRLADGDAAPVPTPPPLARADEVARPQQPRGRGPAGHPRGERVVPKSRDFR